MTANAPLAGPAAAATPARAAGLAWLVAEREITTRVRSKAFLVSTGILLLLVLASVLLGGFASKLGGDTKVAVVGTAGAVLEQAPGFDLQKVADQPAAEKLVRSGDVDAAIVPGGSGAGGVTVLAKDSAPASVVQLLSVQPEVKLLDPLDKNPMLAYFIAIGFGIVFMMSAVTFGTTIAQSVVEEKQTRIVEILLATVPARVLLAGKIIGNSILALAQVVAIIALASLGMLATGQDLLFGDLGTALIWFGVLFAFGFVLLATLYAATAALVSRQEDIGSVTSPVMMLVMIPYVLIIVFNSDPEVLGIMSYVPFSAPVGMPMRLYLGIAEWWEPLIAIAILVVTIALVIGLGARIYENSILRTGSRVKLAEAIKG